MIFTVRWNQYPDQLFVAKIMIMQENEVAEKTAAYQSEITALEKLAHPNVIYIFKHFQVDKYYYIILEYCQNGNMTKYVHLNGAMKTATFRDYSKQCLMAIKDCHSNDIAHLDIKPDNILLSDYNQIKICDFGLAEINARGFCEKAKGSILYCAPERFGNSTFDSKKADIWALGITFFFFVNGELPWKVATREDVRDCVKRGDIEFVRQVDPQIEEIIRLMLNPDPEMRPTAEDVLAHDFYRIRTSVSVKKACITSYLSNGLEIERRAHHSYRRAISLSASMVLNFGMMSPQTYQPIPGLLAKRSNSSIRKFPIVKPKPKGTLLLNRL